MSDATIPPEVLAVTGRWLDGVENALRRIADTGVASQTGEGLIVASAVDDALVATTHFRRVLAADLPLRDSPRVSTVKVRSIPEALADAISIDVATAISIPEELISVAKQYLAPDDVRPFLGLIGHVASGSISDIAGTLWDSRPDLAPPGWKTDDG